ncbi:MAG TPA: Rv3235 family protein [Actinoplanes sp.]|nr:Rv3235 family protein [Actinoplanes sp.]
MPRYEPPFDDEPAAREWTDSAVLDWPSTRRPTPGPPPSVLPRAEAPIVAGVSGDARLAVRRFVRLCVEVLNGFRPAAHLRRASLPSEAAEVVAQGLAGARRVAELRRQPHPGNRRLDAAAHPRPGTRQSNAGAQPRPPETAREARAGARSPASMGRPTRPAPVAVVGLKLCEPRHGAVEVAVTLVTGDRAWAMAFRMELHQETWVATTLLII